MSVSPGGGVIVENGVEFHQGDVRIGVAVVEAGGVQKQRQSFLAPVCHAIELGEMKVGLGVRGFPRDPGLLLVDETESVLVESGLDDFF